MASKSTPSNSKRVPVKRHDSSFDLIKAKSQNGVVPIPKPVNKARKKPVQVKPKIAEKTEVNTSNTAKDGYDKAAEQQFEKMLEGQLDNIPSIPRSVVRIFLSSTFSDMRAERNAIVREATPKLRDFCAEHDLDFQMVDMRWGVTDDSQNDHSVEKICLLEVENCQKISLGPNFVLIKGSRYGFRPIPSELSSEDFILLSSYTTDPEHTKLLHTWYKRDDNSKPPQYVLQNIRSKFTFFGDYSPGCEEKRAKDAENWQQTFQQLQFILRRAAKSASEAGKMSPAALHGYYQSVTETEIKKGLLDVVDPVAHTVVYSRTFTGLNNESLTDKDIKRYIEIKDNNGKLEVDSKIASLQNDLFNKVKKKLKGLNRREYGTPWVSGGIDPSSNQHHAKYIEQFWNDFLSDMKELIKDGMYDYLPNIRWSEWYTDYAELIHHLQFCNTKCETFCGQDDVLENVKSYILTDTSRKPLVLHAPSGAGKTSIMAMIMKNLSTWFKMKKHVAVIRFIGTSPLSTNIYNVLFGVCAQLADIANIIMDPGTYKTMKNLLEFLPRFLRRAANAIKAPIVIILDSLDQLTPDYNAYSLAWLPTVLPANMKLILSTLPEEHGILNNLRNILPNDKCYIPVPELSLKTGTAIVSKYLGQRKRALTDSQLKYLMSLFTKRPGPLYLKLLLDEAAKWKSYTSEQEHVLADTVQSAISHLFQNMETKFGKVLTNHALGYITIALNGASETEIEDVLSCDDEALNDVYRYHDPPVEGIVRIPPVIWARLRYDLKEYLVERRSHNKYTLNWYHRQFTAVGRALYTQGKDGQKLHKNFSEIFMFHSVKRNIPLQWRKKTIPNADRQITPQAMVSKNVRMLSCLPYYINNAEEMLSSDLAKERCFCNFHFLKAKIAAFPLAILLDDLALFAARTDDKEVQKLKYFFSTCKVEDLSNAEKIAISLLSKISRVEGETHLDRLLTVAREHLESQRKPLLIPKYACMALGTDTSNAMKDSIKGCEDIIAIGGDSVLLRVSGKESDKETNGVYVVYNTITEDQQQVCLPEMFSKGLVPCLDRTGKTVYYLNNGQINMENLSKKVTISKKLIDLSSDLSAESKHVMSTLDTDSSYMAILFENRTILLIDLNSMTLLRLIRLSEEVGVITNLMCTVWDSPAVIVTGEYGGTKKAKNGNGFLQIFPASEESKDTLMKIPFSFTDGLVCFGISEDYLVGLSNTEMACKLTAIKLGEFTVVNELSLPDVMTQVSVARKQPLAAVLSQKGVVTVLNWEKGTILHDMSTNKPVSGLCVNWSNGVAMLGDSQGQISLHNIQTCEHFGTFSAAHESGIHRLFCLDDNLISLCTNKVLATWSIPALLQNAAQSQNQGSDVSGILGQTNVAGVAISLDSQELVVASRDNILSIWSLIDMSLKSKVDIGVRGDKIQFISNESCVALDKTSRNIKIFKPTNGKSSVACDLPKCVFDFTVSKDRSLMCILCQKEKGLMVDVMDLKIGQSRKTFYLKSVPEYETIDISLSANSRYILFRIKVTDEYYKDVEASWKKEESLFYSKPRRHRFSAVDLTQATGGLVHCMRSVSKYAQLGEAIEAFQGNVAMITTRRWVLFWDIPTGKCDKKISKVERKGMVTRPEWLAQDVNSTPITLVISSNGKHLALGLEEGYVFLFSTETGQPITKKSSCSKHATSVILTLFSPDSEWVASACRNNTIKIWEVCTGKEVFSIKAKHEVTSMCFSADSRTLVVSIGTEVTRILAYTFHTGR
ncbi:protein qui-1-like [Argopecten irradians]|uniref:protein qui-1-like n=1 Tax=Argopecten irradians TaxID=31199 RepID=UPI003712E028